MMTVAVDLTIRRGNARTLRWPLKTEEGAVLPIAQDDTFTLTVLPFRSAAVVITSPELVIDRQAGEVSWSYDAGFSATLPDGKVNTYFLARSFSGGADTPATGWLKSLSPSAPADDVEVGVVVVPGATTLDGFAISPEIADRVQLVTGSATGLPRPANLADALVQLLLWAEAQAGVIDHSNPLNTLQG